MATFLNKPRGGQMQPRVSQPPHVLHVKGDMKIDLVTVSQAGEKKKMKRMYIISNPLPPIKEMNFEAYRRFIIDLMMNKGNVTRPEAERYTDEIAMGAFILAMTHDSVNPSQRAENYEMLEHLGDATVNKCTTWYLKNRFPDIIKRGDAGVQIISKQKSLLTSKPFLAKYSEFLGLDKFIRYRPLNFTYAKEDAGGAQSTQVKQVVLDRSMREDVFEAFFGCMEEVVDNKEGLVGVGYAIVFKILSSLYDEQDIPYTKNMLVDAKTQLKELFDRRRKDGETLEYTVNKDTREVSLIIHFEKLPDNPSVMTPFDIVMGPYSTAISGMEGDYETSKRILEQQLAKDALTYLQNKYGSQFVRYGPDE
jgi:dsRNA-specific ribonuclease